MQLSSCLRINGELLAESQVREIQVMQQEAHDQAIEEEQFVEQEPEAIEPSSQKRFNLSVNNIPAQIFFLSLVSDAGVNVVADPEISGQISLELKDVTVDDVLNVTRDVYGYEYTFQNNVYIIYPRKLRTEIFDVNYLNVSRESSTETSVAISAISSNNDTGTNNASGNSNTGSTTNSQQGTSGTTITTKTNTDFWLNLEQTLNAIIGGGDGRSVIVNSHASIIVVKALPKELSRVRKFLERAQLNVSRQIILETKIIEVTLNDGYEAGINWEQFNHQFIYKNDVSTFGATPTIGGLDDSGEFFSSIVVVNDLFRLLAFLETQGSVQVLSSPRVSTVNNQKAIIRVGTDQFFVTGVSSNTTSTATASTTSPEVELTSFFSGISLDVTPQISVDGDVVLHVHPLVSTVEDEQKVFTVGDFEYDLPLALREVRESDSIVRAKSGEVVVLGGLMQETIVQQDTKRPLIGDIPVMGSFFKTQTDRVTKKELVILMRPVVVDDNTWRHDIDGSAGRFKNLGHDFRAQE